MTWYYGECPAPSQRHRDLARKRQDELTKPPGSLGRLEKVAVDFAGWQSRAIPELSRVAVRVFAADHGISRRGVSAFPPEVTAQMVDNFVGGGAAISVLSQPLRADFAVVNMGTFEPVANAPKLHNLQLAPGSADFSEEPALSAALTERCLETGKAQVDMLDCQLFIAGEMGIGNTTAAAAICAAHLGLDGAAVAGRGTGIDDATLRRKRELIDTALNLHAGALDAPLGILQCLGGLEIAALCGAYLRCGQRRIPVLVDGFIATAAALLAAAINPGLRPWLMAAHRSSEGAHGRALDALGLDPLLDLGMRLGEGSGAAVAVPILQSALRLHAQMATFHQAHVQEGETHT
ncbi:nicotinate-nucleotide--dimethylbenzimidazole phosphoribosyltransferase [Parahaliea mediterranea]|uniref:Nicotinate-nucleotide--dimethylbenzimidazole phosphoribosyltransferase n=1 Tax=Parahaliea mediterranea TaxID=651086 RepID=A0A939DDR5_9GAMM|nr:nicotinate-nucleotide--dimethylbenzimidazole phosphoribosyltransferase [Parahaliea mediterranea]MBN7796219.1 nicotinate-nucleotide--dimethylbenzimidazole phosphoribosyltransferase [Parahaliea mediterranea]